MDYVACVALEFHKITCLKLRLEKVNKRHRRRLAGTPHVRDIHVSRTSLPSRRYMYTTLLKFS
jgi:hypothetical protein